MEIAAQLSLYIPRGKLNTWKNREYVEYLEQHSTDFCYFHQNDRAVFGHLTFVKDDVKNLGQGQHLQMIISIVRIFLSKLSTSNLADGNR